MNIMDNERVNQLLDEVEEHLKGLFKTKLLNLILFGSYARGDYDDESDIDIIALVDETELKRYTDAIIDLEVDLTIKYGIVPSIMVENESDFNRYRKLEFLYQNVLEEGKVIYAA